MAQVIIAEEICKGCLYCVEFCPKGVLTQGERLNTKGYHYVVAADPDQCVCCKQCTDICPDSAITIYK